MQHEIFGEMFHSVQHDMARQGVALRFDGYNNGNRRRSSPNRPTFYSPPPDYQRPAPAGDRSRRGGDAGLSPGRAAGVADRALRSTGSEYRGWAEAAVG